MWNECCLWLPWSCVQHNQYDNPNSKISCDPRIAFFSFLWAGACPCTAWLPCLDGTWLLGPLSSETSPAEGFTGLRVRTWRVSLVVCCILPVCRSLKGLEAPFDLCAPDAVLRGGALLAESSGITSPEESGLSFAAVRDEVTRDFAPNIVDGPRSCSALVRAVPAPDIVTFHPFVSLNIDS